MPTPDQMREKLLARMYDILRSTFGFDGFKGKQEEAILATLTGRDCLVLMPTGGGKSLCYALPALLQPGFALVVSPLIALMQNQVEGFRAAGVAAAALSSATPAAERERLLSDISGTGAPATKLLFVTPELLSTEGFQARLRGLGKQRRVSLLAIDEAHCISSWGHDFRPSYRRLAHARRCLPGVPVLALTATAAEKVQEDIVQQLRFGPAAARLVSSFDRPNIHYRVRYVDNLPHEDRIADIAALMEAAQARAPNKQQPSAIMYTLKRDTASEVAAALTRKGVQCKAYHAGLKPAIREQVLADWTAGRLPCVAATIAFGMGIDRAAVRLVVHFNLPKTLEGFYQESGRAGRDGLPAQSVLYFEVADRRRMDYLTQKGDRRRGKKRKVADGGVSAEQEAAAAARHFGEVVAYATTASCRRRALLSHFGEKLPRGRCAGCDVCDDVVAVEQQLARVEAKALGSQQNGRFGQRLEFGGSGGGSRKRHRGGAGGGLTDYDAEDWAAGLSDKDDAGPSHGFGGGAESSGDEDSDEEREAAMATAIAVRARAAGGTPEAAVAALQRAEESQNRKPEPRGAAARLLQRLEGGSTAAGGIHPGAAAPPSAATSGVDDAARQRGRAHLAKALAANARLGLTEPQAQAAAEALEVSAFGGGGAGAGVYRSKLAAAARAATAATSALSLPPEAAAAADAATDAAAGDATAAHATAGHAAGDAAAAATGHTGHSSTLAGAAEGAAGSNEPTASGANRKAAAAPTAAAASRSSATANGVAHQEEAMASVDAADLTAAFQGVQQQLAAGDAAVAAAGLRRLGGMPVTANVLAETGLGRKLRPLTKHDAAAVAAAATDAVAAWKAAVLAQRRG